MSRELFELWAPDGDEWTQWAKPAPFVGTAMMYANGSASFTMMELDGVPQFPDMAVVLDLPGPESVRLGMLLAQRGMRAVPLINTTSGSSAAIDMGSVMKELRDCANALRDLEIPPDAPPVFILDSRRNAPGYSPRPKTYDNRWLVFPQDFPSGNYMFARGIRRTVVITRDSGIKDDMLHVLRRWQEAGVRILLGSALGGPPVETDVPKPSRFKAAWYRLLVAAGLKKNSAGGFGGFIPEPSQSSGRSGFG
jgi:hypothetical protein